jgi:hypothetical protein
MDRSWSPVFIADRTFPPQKKMLSFGQQHVLVEDQSAADDLPPPSADRKTSRLALT